MTAVTTAPGAPAPLTSIRSIDMFCLHEVLARDRIRQAEERARRHTVARELAATRRWQRVSTIARAAERRHAARVEEVAVATL